LIDEGVVFLGQNTYKIETPYSLDTAFLSLMERCDTSGVDDLGADVDLPTLKATQRTSC